MEVSEEQIEAFQQMLREYYRAHGRHDLPWRQTTDSYHILVSELMLQQTQVKRVIPKYHEFLKKFPDVQSLAKAPLSEVVVAWQGLGYNRRAKFLWQTAQQVVTEFKGRVPHEIDQLTRLPGIGTNTAGAIAAYAFNQPVIFVETNVRTVYFHHFFEDRTDISDREIRDVLRQTLDTASPREFYWAVMDYGSQLKAGGQNLNARSRHYAKQSPFEGSRRQVRGALLRALTGRGYSKAELLNKLADVRGEMVLDELLREGFIAQTDGVYHLA
jgi:A/G-specific adenine glycosylase